LNVLFFSLEMQCAQRKELFSFRWRVSNPTGSQQRQASFHIVVGSLLDNSSSVNHRYSFKILGKWG